MPGVLATTGIFRPRGVRNIIFRTSKFSQPKPNSPVGWKERCYPPPELGYFEKRWQAAALQIGSDAIPLLKDGYFVTPVSLTLPCLEF